MTRTLSWPGVKMTLRNMSTDALAWGQPRRNRRFDGRTMRSIKYFGALTLCMAVMLSPGAVHALTLTLSGGNFDALGDRVTLGTAVLESGGLLQSIDLSVKDLVGTVADINGTFDPDDLKSYRDLLIPPADLDLQHVFDGITYLAKIGTTLAAGTIEFGCDPDILDDTGICVEVPFHSDGSNWVTNELEVSTPSSWGAIGFAPNSATFTGDGDFGTLSVELKILTLLAGGGISEDILFSAFGTPNSVVDELNLGFFQPRDFTDVPVGFVFQEVYILDDTFGTFTFDPIHGIIPAVPEPATLALLGLSFVGIGFMRRGWAR